MPSNMVTGGADGDLPAAQNTPYAVTLKANQPLLPQHQFIRKTWSPRTGYSKQYEDWLEELTRLLKALGLRLEDLHTPCPQLDAPPQTPSPYLPFSDLDGKREQKIKWQSDSTTLYFHVVASLTLDGLYAKVDKALGRGRSAALSTEMTLRAMRGCSVRSQYSCQCNVLVGM